MLTAPPPPPLDLAAARAKSSSTVSPLSSPLPLHSASPWRWWVLFIYASLACLQAWQWAVPGGIGASMEDLYDLDGYTVQLLINWGPIVYLPAAPLFSLLLNGRDGLRRVTLLGLLLVVLGAVCRLAADSGTLSSLALLHAGYIINAAAGPAGMGCVSTLAEAWFPASERGLATAVGTQANLLGSVLAFIIGPAMVPDAAVGGAPSEHANNTAYNALFLALALAALLAAGAYFPSLPPLPPSASAAATAAAAAAHGGEGGAAPAAHADNTLAGSLASLRLLARNRNFVVLAVTYGLTQGMISSWGTTFALNLRGVGVSQATAGWIGCASGVAGNVGGLAVGGLADRLRNHRAVVIGALVAAAAFLAWFTAVVAVGVAGAAVTAQVTVAATAAGLCINSIASLYFELAVEATYPDVPEATTVMLMTTLNNVGGLILLAVPIATAAAAFNVLICVAVAGSAVAVAFFFVDDGRRWKIDAEAATAAAAAAAAGGLEDRRANEAAGAAGGEAELAETLLVSQPPTAAR